MASMQDLLSWTPTVQADTTADDSDKTITVPTGEIWQVQTIYVDYTSTSTAGNRQLVVQFRDDSDNIVGEARAGATQAASLQYFYTFSLTGADMTAVRDTDQLSVGLPLMTLQSGYDIRIFDNNAVAAAADDMTVRVSALKRAR